MASKEQILEKVAYLLVNAQKRMSERAERILASGRTDVDGADDDFVVPKQIITALLEFESKQYTPFNEEDRKVFLREVANMQYF